MPALKALDRYTKLSTHEQTLAPTAGSPQLSDIKSVRRYNQRNRRPLALAFSSRSPAGAVRRGDLRHHSALQRANIFLRVAPIFAFPPLKFFVADSCAQLFKRVPKTDRVGSHILIDVSFDQGMAMRTLRAC